MAIDPIYFTDDYPRQGCIVAVDVQENGYALTVRAPNGALLETYAVVKTPRAVARMVEEWCAGFAPRLRDRLDQSGSSVTEKTYPKESA